MAGDEAPEWLEIDGRQVAVTHPSKPYFRVAGITKLDVVRYYLAVAEGALRGVSGRPMALKRYVNGAAGEFFVQKRAPDNRPEWIETVELKFPSGRTADEVVLRDAAQLAWIINLGCIDLNPHPVRTGDLDHPDELRVDLDPVPGVAWPQIREVALVTRDVLARHGLVGFPKTSGSRGMHIYARLQPRWSFTEVRRAALAIAREVERDAPGIATSKWWKEERQGVFLDYNQNAKDRTVASVYSVRPLPDARVSMPLSWDDVPACDPRDFTLATVPALYAASGDAGAGIDERAGSLESLLELFERQGEGDAPWPPHYEKQEGEPPRAQPSRRRKPAPTPVASPAPGTTRRRVTKPLITIGKAQLKDDALAGLERWKARHPDVVGYLEPRDILVDAMRGRNTIWTRVRVNLEHVPEELRPAEEPPDPDFDLRDAK